MVSKTFVLTPFLTTSSSDAALLLQSARRRLGVQDLEMFQMVPVTSTIVEGEVVFKVKKSALTLENIEARNTLNQQLKRQLEMCQEVVRTMSQMLAIPNSVCDTSVADLVQHFRGIEDENFKLKELLKTQLEHNERARSETKCIIEALMEEFEVLMRQINGEVGRWNDGVKYRPGETLEGEVSYV